MALWGATAGVATLVGPILGGVLVDAPRLGVDLLHQHAGRRGRLRAGLAAGADAADAHATSFDWLGVALSGVGMFLLVFGIQEGHQYDWDAWVIWRSIVAGLVVLGAVRALAGAQHAASRWCRSSLFRDRNFSLANFAISAMGFAITAMGYPAHALRPAGARAAARPSRRCCWCRWR